MSKVARATIGLMIATMLAKVIGFLRELVLASSYGASMYSDAYLIAISIPTVIFTSIGVAIGTTFIPMYFDINNGLGKRSALKFTNNILNMVIVLCILLSIVGFIFIEPLVKIFAFGFEPDVFNITVKFTKILILGIVFTGMSNVMTSYLQVNNNFIIPGFANIPYNIIIIISIILSVKYNPDIMVWGTLIGIVFQFIFQFPFATKCGFKYKFSLNFKDEHIKKTIWLLGPVLIGVAVNQINVAVDKALASTLVEGSISALNYANKLNAFIIALFISTLSAVIYPTLSKLSSENNKEKFIDAISSSVNSVILLVIPISVGAMVLSTPIVRVLFKRGAFDERATYMTAIALVFYSVGMVGFGLRDILGKVFYSLQDTKTPMINGAMAMVLNIILNLILVKFMGHAGLALATSISSIICIFLLFRSLKKKIGYFGQDKIAKATIKSLVAAIVMGIVTFFAYKVLVGLLGLGFIAEVVSLFGATGIGAIVYCILVIALKVEEVSVIIDIVKKKIKI
jgi:putative peptidoglycan lipid II flippase